MLVLSRKKNEEIYIGDNIRIVIVDIRGDKIRIGIDAPPEVVVLRGELVGVPPVPGGALDRPIVPAAHRAGLAGPTGPTADSLVGLPAEPVNTPEVRKGLGSRIRK